MPESIATLVDLTHPQELLQFGKYLLVAFFGLGLLVFLLGLMLSALGLAGSRGAFGPGSPAAEWAGRYGGLLYGLQHGLVVLALLAVGFAVCSTLANRYHHWEQQRAAKVVMQVSGARLEQPAPEVYHRVKETVLVDVYERGKYVKKEREQVSNVALNLAGSQIRVVLDQVGDPHNPQVATYKVDFQADYDLVNVLERPETIYFNARQSEGHTLLQNFRVERDGAPLSPRVPGSFEFGLLMQPGQKTKYRVNYLAQGGPRWVYNAYGMLLSNFRLTAQANFPSAEFASGVLPTEVKTDGRGTTFVWDFKENVSVKNPFGVFTSTAPPARKTGVLPRLLLLAPGILAWWLLLLYLSVPPRPRQVLVLGLAFFVALLALAYFGRLVDPRIAWVPLALFLMGIAAAVSVEPVDRSPLVQSAIPGAVLPVFGLLISYSGLTLGLAGLLAVAWLAYSRAAPRPSSLAAD